MKVLFLGNHTVGIKALQTISKTDEVVGVVAHPPDPEDGTRYLSVFDFAVKNDWQVIRSTGKDPALAHFINDASPDLLWITDYRYLLSASILSSAPLGTVNLHPSLLPKYRGRAPVNWAILNGERTLGLTAHFVDAGMDSGDIIEQISFELSPEQGIGDALQILYPLYQEITYRVLTQFKAGQIHRCPQNHSLATTYPRRKPKDGLIDWNKSAETIHNLIRAVTKPYPGAFTFYQGKKMMIWSAKYHSDLNGLGVPGQILGIEQDGFVVCTGNGTILVNQLEQADTQQVIVPKTGEKLERLL